MWTQSLELKFDMFYTEVEQSFPSLHPVYMKALKLQNAFYPDIPLEAFYHQLRPREKKDPPVKVPKEVKSSDERSRIADVKAQEAEERAKRLERMAALVSVQ